MSRGLDALYLTLFFSIMAKESTIEVVNTKERSFNGFKKGEQATIPEHQASEYLSNGFELITASKAEKPEAKTVDASLKFDRQ